MFTVYFSTSFPILFKLNEDSTFGSPMTRTTSVFYTTQLDFHYITSFYIFLLFLTDSLGNSIVFSPAECTFLFLLILLVSLFCFQTLYCYYADLFISSKFYTSFHLFILSRVSPLPKIAFLFVTFTSFLK